jgi:hypothetical protein
VVEEDVALRDVEPAAAELAEVGSAVVERQKIFWPVRFAPPLLALFYSYALLVLGARRAQVANHLFSGWTWARYDSGLYASIAEHGYTFFRCPAKEAWPPGSWCGTTGWMPLYPWTMELLHRCGLSIFAAGVVVSAILSYFVLLTAWTLIGPELRIGHLTALALAASFPGLVYFYAVFPISMVVLFALLAILALDRRRYLLAGLAAAAASWSYATGFVLIPVLAAAAPLTDWGSSIWNRAKHTMESAGVALAGFLALLAGFWWWAGNWQAFFLDQAKYGNGIHNPVTEFLAPFIGFVSPDKHVSLNKGYQVHAAQAQEVLVLVLVVLAVGVAYTVRDRLSIIVAIYTVCFWIVPLLQGPELSRYRSEALLLPCVVLLRRLPIPVQLVLVAISSWVAVGLSVAFFRVAIV